MQTGPPWVWVPVGAIGQVVAKAWVANRPAAANPAKPRYLVAFIRAPVFLMQRFWSGADTKHVPCQNYKLLIANTFTDSQEPARSTGCKLCRHFVKALKPVIPAAGAEKALRLPAIDLTKQNRAAAASVFPQFDSEQDAYWLRSGNWRAPQSNRRRSP
jgi:hypothetical protein